MRIAHLSDLHLLERTERHAFGVRFVSLGRRLDAEERLGKARVAVAAARAAGADHFLFTGDLTETGTPAQFEAFAEMLAECKLRPDEVTLVPGNHDAYTSPAGWREALEGPLAPFAKNAALAPGKIVETAGAFLLPIDATFHQPITRSAGRFDEDIERALEARLADRGLARVPLVVAIHHPPHPRPGPWHWVDGLLGGNRLLAAIARAAHVVVAHGHLHKAGLRTHGLARVASAAAIVDGALPSLLGEPAAFALVA